MITVYTKDVHFDLVDIRVAKPVRSMLLEHH